MTAGRVSPEQAAQLLAGATPGPWISLTAAAEPRYRLIAEPTESTVAAVFKSADTALIAAAPGLAGEVVRLAEERDRAITQRDEARAWASTMRDEVDPTWARSNGLTLALPWEVADVQPRPDEQRAACEHGVNAGFACNECSLAARRTVIVPRPDEQENRDD